MQFQFDATQPHQLEAIQSVVDVLDGQFNERLYGQDFYSADVVPNVDSYWSWNDDNEEILSSMLTSVRTKNKLNERVAVTFDEGDSLRGLHWHRSPHFTIEMETGTGKTYVYLRTMFELHRAYQLSKFVIVVPSIAIYEGVVKAEQIMRKHLSELYPGVVFSLIKFDGDKLSDLRDFATRSTSEINILILTRDSFNKSSNNLYKETYKLMGGKFPINYIAETRPVVILDEPQNMRTERSKQALRELQPLCVLRYSATHKENPNQIFTLTPIEAFNQGLVKRISVIGVEADKHGGQIAADVSLSLLKIEFKAKTKKNEWQATFLANINEKGVLKAKEVTLKQGDDLARKTKNPLYTGYVIGEEGAIDGTNKSVTFDNQITLTLSDSDGDVDEVLYREQIRRTIEVHIEKQRQMRPHGVKVLSLFFIDRVKHYTLAQGVVRQLFEEEYEKQRHNSVHLLEHIDISEMHSGYFAKNTIGEEIDLEIDMDGELKNADSRKLAKDAFSLIMRDKERLLSFKEPVQFIFAHSALREGWDNPNVFQICTLRQLKAETARRQTIGRGLRLCVDQEGVRLTDPSLNNLTVIVPESFADYVNKLQQEYVDEGYQSPPKPTDTTGNPPKVTRRESIYTNGVFRQFWTSLNRMSNYTIYSDTDVLINTVAEELKNSSPPRVEVRATYGEWRWAEVVLSFGALHYTKDNIPGGCYVTLVLKDTQGITHRYENIRVNVGKTLAHVFSQVEQTLRNELKRYKLKEIEIIDKDYYRAIFVTIANQEILVSSTKPLVLAVSSSVGEYMDSVQPSMWGLSVQNLNIQYIESDVDNVNSRKAMLNVPILLAREITNRLMRETGLTRQTVVRIWKSLGTNHQISFIKHKEMCFEWLLNIVRNILVNHIAERISFNVDLEKQNDMFVDDEIFEREMSLSQVEIIETNAKSLYTHVWRDSDIEENFISRIQADNQIVCWFKFPSKFKLKLPKLIGNYNPDWGIVRHDVQGSRIELVRETKGTDKINDLSSSERAKVNCAIRLFEALGVKYRVVTDKTEKWWE